MIVKTLRQFIPNFLIDKLKQKLGVPSQENSFIKLKNLGFYPKTILDIGAYEGNWSVEMSSIFPKAEILMIEGQKSKETILKEKAFKIPNCSVHIALLGAATTEVEFNQYETASSVFKEDNITNANTENITLQLLDDVASQYGFDKVDFIKLDTQGYELEILKGGNNILQSAKVVLMEVSFLQIYKDAPLVDEIIYYMKNKGFVIYDICSLMYRPYDNALYQSDFLFVKESLNLRTSTRWI